MLQACELSMLQACGAHLLALKLSPSGSSAPASSSLLPPPLQHQSPQLSGLEPFPGGSSCDPTNARYSTRSDGTMVTGDCLRMVTCQTAPFLLPQCASYPPLTPMLPVAPSSRCNPVQHSLSFLATLPTLLPRTHPSAHQAGLCQDSLKVSKVARPGAFLPGPCSTTRGTWARGASSQRQPCNGLVPHSLALPVGGALSVGVQHVQLLHKLHTSPRTFAWQALAGCGGEVLSRSVGRQGCARVGHKGGMWHLRQVQRVAVLEAPKGADLMSACMGHRGSMLFPRLAHQACLLCVVMQIQPQLSPAAPRGHSTAHTSFWLGTGLCLHSKFS